MAHSQHKMETDTKYWEIRMSECQMCHAEDSTVLDFCEDCYDEMKGEAEEAGQEFNKYWGFEHTGEENEN